MRRVLTIGLFVMVAANPTMAAGQEKFGELAKLQADAMKSSPDIKIADAKVRIVELERELVLLQLNNQIAVAFAEWESSKAAEAEAKIRRNEAGELLTKKAINREEYGSAVLTFIKLGGERVSAQQKLANVVGRPLSDKQEGLDKLQADARKDHPDIKIADAKVRIVELELEKARVHLKNQISSAHAEWMSAVAGEREGQIRKLTADELFQKKAINREEQSAAALTWLKLQGERVIAEQRLQNLVGRQMQGKDTPKKQQDNK